MKQNWVIVTLTLLLLVSVSVLTLHLHYEGIREVLSRFQDHQLSYAKHLSNQIQFFIQARSRGLRALSSFPSFYTGNLKQQTKDIESPLEPFGRFVEGSTLARLQEEYVATFGINPLSKVKSKKFDLTAEFDLSECKAGKFGFRVANKTIEYDVNAATLLGKELKPDASGKIRIRLLVDWGQLVVFSNNGLYSYSEQFAFTPENNNIEFYTDCELNIVSMEFHEVARIW